MTSRSTATSPIRRLALFAIRPFESADIAHVEC